MATLRDLAIDTLAKSGAPAVLQTAGTALGMPALKAAGAGLALAAKPSTKARAEEDLFDKDEVTTQEDLFDKDEVTTQEDLFDKDEVTTQEDLFDKDEVTTQEDLFDKDEVAPAEPVGMAEEPTPTVDVAAPGTFRPIMRPMPLEKLAGATVGVAQSLADVALATGEGPAKSASGQARKRLSESAGQVEQAITGVIQDRTKQGLAANVGEDLYDLVAMLPRLGMSVLAEEPVGTDAFESARQAGYSVVPGMAGQAGAAIQDPLGYARSMPVSTAIDLTPVGRVAKIMTPAKVTKAIQRALPFNPTRMRDVIMPVAQEVDEATIGFSKPVQQAQDLVDNTAETLDRLEGRAAREREDLVAAQARMEEVGPHAGYQDVADAEDKLRYTEDRISYEAEKLQDQSRMVDEAKRLATEAHEKVRNPLYERLTNEPYTGSSLATAAVEGAQSLVSKALGRLFPATAAGVKRIPVREAAAKYRRQFTEPTAQTRPLYEDVATALLRPEESSPTMVVAAKDIERSARTLAGDAGTTGAPATIYTSAGKLDPAKDAREWFKRITAEYPTGSEVPTPPQLKSVVGDVATIDPGLAATLMPMVDAGLAKSNFVQFQNTIKGALTTGSPVSILNNLGSNILLQAFRRGPVGSTLAAYNAVKHTANLAQPGTIPGMSKYNRALQILEDLKLLDRDALTVDANRVGMNRVWDRISQATTLGDWLPKLYRLGDKALKLEETMYNLDRYTKYINGLTPGEFVEFRMTPRHVLRIDNENGKLYQRVFRPSGVPGPRLAISTDLERVSPELVRAAAQTGLDAFFDYEDVPNFLKQMRGAPIVGIASPFTTWAYKAMDLPGKAGLGTEALMGPRGFIRSNSLDVRTSEAGRLLGQAAGRALILEAAHRQLLQDEGAEAKEVAQAISYLPKEPRIAMVRAITNPATKQASEYAYLAQGGNWNFMGPTDRLLRLGVWGYTHLANNPDEIRELARKVRDDKTADPEERLEAERTLRRLYNVYSGKTADASDVLELAGLGGSSILQLWERLSKDEAMGQETSAGAISAELLKSMGMVGLAAKAYANAFPEDEIFGMGRGLRDRSRDLVQPDEALRQSLARVMIKNVLGTTWKLLPLTTIENKTYPDRVSEVDRYFNRITKELEASTKTSKRDIDQLKLEAQELAYARRIEQAEERLRQAQAREDLRIVLFGRPGDENMPAVLGEIDNAKIELLQTIDKLGKFPSKRK